MATTADAHDRWGWWLILALLVLHTANLANSSSVVDTARDVYNAWRIAGEGEWVMRGPVLAGVLHAGPMWFYLLGVPMWFSDAWLPVALWAGFLAALKYPLAYVIGRELRGPALGLLFAAMLALPGWPSLWLVISHVSLVETATLAIAASALLWRTRRQLIWLLLLPPAMVAGLHAHPTVYVAAVFAGLAVLPTFRSQPLSVRTFLFGCGLGLLLFAPYLVQQAWAGWPDLATSGGYLSQLSLLENLQRLPDIVHGAIWNGPEASIRQWHVAPLFAELSIWAVRGVVLLGMLSALIQALGFGAQAGLARRAWFMWVLAFVGVALIRDFTPGYMIFVTLPLTAWLVSLGWLPAPAVWRTGLMLAVLLGLALTYRGNDLLSDGLRTEYPNTWLRDVAAEEAGWAQEVLHFPAHSRTELAQWLCDAQQPVTVHGYGAIVLEQSYAMEMRMRCGAGAGLFLAGADNPGRHWLGLHIGDARRLGVKTGEQIGSLMFVPVLKAYQPPMPVAVPVGDDYPPRAFLRGETSTLTTDVHSTGRQWVAVSNAYVVWNPGEAQLELQSAGEVEKLNGLLSDFYRCSSCAADETVIWRLTATAPAPEYVEAVVFEP